MIGTGANSYRQIGGIQSYDQNGIDLDGAGGSNVDIGGENWNAGKMFMDNLVE